MMNSILKVCVLVLPVMLILAGCSPEVGSKAWCASMDKKPKGDWSGNEAADYAKNCIFK